MTSTNRTPQLDERSRLSLDLHEAYVLVRRKESELASAQARVREIIAQLDRAKITR